jgi:YesN/AraC family two-component response regulator
MKEMKILVVDDNQTVAFTTEAILAHENHHVKTANNGDDGYSAYLHFEPEVVITDIQMPHKNGFQMMETIRSHNPEVKAIYMSGNLNLFHSELEMEKNRYAAIPLSKPFTRTDLLSALRTI